MTSQDRHENIIEIKNLTKYYGNLKALDNIELNIPKGKIFGLIGPNGAGKTTLVKSILDLVHIDSGTLIIDGLSAKDKNARKNISFLPEKFSYYKFETVLTTMKFFARLKNIAAENSQQQIMAALKRMDIEELQDKKIKALSKGQLQRLGLACVCLGQNKLIILDEPFSGLDPIGIKDMKDMLIEMNKGDISILINTHNLAEAQTLCQNLAILNKGRCLASGATHDLIGTKRLEEYFYDLIKSQEK